MVPSDQWPASHYELWMAETLKCLVLHLSRNLSLLHRRVTPRLGAMRGGSGRAVRRRKLMVRRTVVMRWYQATTNILNPFSPTEVSANRTESVWWLGSSGLLSPTLYDLGSLHADLQLQPSEWRSCWRLWWLHHWSHSLPGTRRVVVGRSYITSYFKLPLSTDGLVGLQGY